MRVHTVNKAQKTAGTCVHCQQPVLAGEGYSWAAPFRSHRRIVRHTACGPFRSSQIASNDKLSALYAIQETIEDWIESSANDEFTLDDAKAVMDEAGDAAEEVASQYEESASSIEDGFGHSTYQSEEMTEYAEQCNDWASTLHDALDSVDELDEDEEDEDEPLTDEQKAAKIDEWRQEVLSAMQDAANECPL